MSAAPLAPEEKNMQTVFASYAGGHSVSLYETKETPFTWRFTRKLWLSDALKTLVLLAFLFPYVRLVPNANDIQAHVFLVALVAGGLVILQNKPVINWLALTAVAPILVGLFYADPLAEIARATAIYAGVFLVYVFTTQAIKDGFPLISLLKAVFFANLLIGLWQFLIDPSAFDFLAPVRSSTDRGVTSLSVEPSFYGLAMAMTALTIVAFGRSVAERALYAGLGAVQVVVLSQSSLAILFALGCLGLYVLSLGNIRRTALILFGGIAVSAVAFAFLMPGDSRAYRVIYGLATNPWSVLQEDVSVALRVSHVLLSNLGAATSLLVPNGFSGFDKFLSQLTDWPLHIDPTNRIMSGYGSALFELGFFALPLLYYNFKPLWAPRSSVPRLRLAVLAFGLFFLFQNAVSFALPLYAIVLAILNTSTETAQNE